MPLLIDTNILLYAVNQSDPNHRRCRDYLDEQRRSPIGWCLTWPVIYEFFRVSTHPRVFPRPLRHTEALAFVEALLASPTLIILSPTTRHRELLRATLAQIPLPAGNVFHDIATAVTMREHGVSEIATADTDFLQFPFLSVRNPLPEQG